MFIFDFWFYFCFIMNNLKQKQQNKISVINLLPLLPDDELNRIARLTKVNHYVKVLDGKSIFCLLLYSLVECQRNSLRTMENIFNSSAFKFLFNLPGEKTVKYNSISERLSIINLEFFRQSYDLIFSIFNQYYSQAEIEKKRLVRVDSTMVAEAANKLKKGMNIGSKTTKKQIKYTVAFDGISPSMAEIFTDRSHFAHTSLYGEVQNV